MMLIPVKHRFGDRRLFGIKRENYVCSLVSLGSDLHVMDVVTKIVVVFTIQSEPLISRYSDDEEKKVGECVFSYKPFART